MEPLLLDSNIPISKESRSKTIFLTIQEKIRGWFAEENNDEKQDKPLLLLLFSLSNRVLL